MLGGRAGNILATSFMVSAGDDVASLVGFGTPSTAGAPKQPAGDDTFGQANRGTGIKRFI